MRYCWQRQSFVVNASSYQAVGMREVSSPRISVALSSVGATQESAVAALDTVISSKARQMALNIATSMRTSTPWHLVILYNQRYRAGWLVQRLLSDFEHRRYVPPNHDCVGNTVEQQKLALVVSFETSTGRVQGQSIGGGPGTNLVVATDDFVNFLMRVEWYNQTALLRPADFMRYREDVFNHALRYYSTSPVLRDMWRVLLVAANDRLAANQQIGPEASIAVLERVMRVNMLSVQRTHRVGLQGTPDHVHRSALRKGLKVVQAHHDVDPDGHCKAKYVQVIAAVRAFA